MNESPAVAICIVTYNAESDLPGCLEAVGALAHRPLEVVLVDNASLDGSVQAARAAVPSGIPTAIVPLAENRGFAGGMNEALRHTSAPFVLLLNADARPERNYVCLLLEPFLDPEGPRIGATTGRLVRWEKGADGSPTLDACGMRLTWTWRHLDRGSGEPDRGQFARKERVFGATGAASLFSRQALDDTAVEGEVFDSWFHSFREDAELCFRLRERCWEIVYVPSAVARHRRWNLPRTRREMPSFVNFHSYKNRFLLRAYHQTWPNALLTLFPSLFRDLGAFFYAVAFEPHSLAAIAWVWRHRRRIWARRRFIQGRRLCGSWSLDRWFFQKGEAL